MRSRLLALASIGLAALAAGGAWTALRRAGEPGDVVTPTEGSGSPSARMPGTLLAPEADVQRDPTRHEPPAPTPAPPVEHIPRAQLADLRNEEPLVGTRNDGVRTIVSGTVTDTWGKPVESFLLELSLIESGAHRNGEGTAGRFALKDYSLRPKHSSRAVLTVEACGFARSKTKLELNGGEDAEVRVVLAEEQPQVFGRILDASGRPVAGAQVTAVPSSRFGRSADAKSDAGGWFALHCAHADEVFGLVVSHDRHPTRGIALDDVGGRWDGVVIELEPSCAITGSIVDSDGRALGGMRIQAGSVPIGLGLKSASGFMAMSGPDGKFHLGGLPSGEVEIEFYRLISEGHYRRCHSETVEVRAEARDGLIFRLPDSRL